MTTNVLLIQMTVTRMHPVQTLLVLLRVPVILATVVTALHVPMTTNAPPIQTTVMQMLFALTQLAPLHAHVIADTPVTGAHAQVCFQLLF